MLVLLAGSGRAGAALDNVILHDIMIAPGPGRQGDGPIRDRVSARRG
jgi:hypothetical protein